MRFENKGLMAKLLSSSCLLKVGGSLAVSSGDSKLELFTPGQVREPGVLLQDRTLQAMGDFMLCGATAQVLWFGLSGEVG